MVLFALRNALVTLNIKGSYYLLNNKKNKYYEEKFFKHYVDCDGNPLDTINKSVHFIYISYN